MEKQERITEYKIENGKRNVENSWIKEENEKK